MTVAHTSTDSAGNGAGSSAGAGASAGSATGSRTPTRPAAGAPTTTAAGPPTKHQLALMIWVAVFPTLTVLNLALRSALSDLPVVARTFVLATVAVPIVIYGVMPHLHRLRARLIAVRAAA